MQKRIWLGWMLALTLAAAVWVAMAWRPWEPVGGQGTTARSAEPAALTPDQIRGRLFEQGAISGTEPAGDWCVHDGQLRACPALRKRFDYYILALGEADAQHIRTLTADEARKAHGELLAAQIMAVWDRYWRLRNDAAATAPASSASEAAMSAAQAPRRLRQQILGEDWARAFYGDPAQP